MINDMDDHHLRTETFFLGKGFISSNVKDVMSMSTSTRFWPKALTKGCFDRHPYAEMLVTGSFDKTVKFWS